jgi:hypothetical protein
LRKQSSVLLSRKSGGSWMEEWFFIISLALVLLQHFAFIIIIIPFLFLMAVLNYIYLFHFY